MLQVEEEFVKEAYKAACADWKKKLEEKFPSVFPTPPKVGQRYMNGDNEYILCRTDREDICLIHLGTGNRFSNPIRVENSCQITEEEFRGLCSTDKFTLKK